MSTAPAIPLRKTLLRYSQLDVLLVAFAFVQGRGSRLAERACGAEQRHYDDHKEHRHLHSVHLQSPVVEHD